MKFSRILPIVMVLASADAATADDGLYEDAIDPSSSFVRVVAPGETVGSIDGNTLRDLNAGVSDFVNVMPGNIEVVLPGGNLDFDVDPSTHYTLILSEGGEWTVVVDDIANSPAKADISLYNLSQVDVVDLFVPAANAVAIGGVSSLEAQTVAVRAPLILDFELRTDGDVIAEVSQVELERGAGVSIVLIDGSDGVLAQVIENSYQK